VRNNMYNISAIPLRRFLLIFLLFIPIIINCQRQTLTDASVSLAEQLSSQLEANSSVAVAGFLDIDTDEGHPISNSLQENLLTDLFNISRDKFTIVERRAIEQALRELNFQISDLVDKNNIQKLGRFLGANTIIVGYIGPSDAGISVNARAVQVQELKIVAVGRAEINQIGSIEDKSYKQQLESYTIYGYLEMIKDKYDPIKKWFLTAAILIIISFMLIIISSIIMVIVKVKLESVLRYLVFSSLWGIIISFICCLPINILEEMIGSFAFSPIILGPIILLPPAFTFSSVILDLGFNDLDDLNKIALCFGISVIGGCVGGYFLIPIVEPYVIMIISSI